MMPEIEMIFECPGCGQYIQSADYSSGNTFGAVLYSDGQIKGSMMVLYPDLTRCFSCRAIFRLSKLKSVGMFGVATINGTAVRLDAPRAEFLDIEGNFEALDLGMAENQEQEVTIRCAIWRLYNDRIRNREKQFNSAADEERWLHNCRALLAILSLRNIEEKLIAAELYRNLGDFENSSILLQSIVDEDYRSIKEKLLQECKRKNKRLIRLN